jgi:acetoacetyl-CoA synthetase
MAQFRELAKVRTRRNFESYGELHDWSVGPATAGDFWMLLFEYLGMGDSIKPTKAFEWVS